jgi:hypothetical protein
MATGQQILVRGSQHCRRRTVFQSLDIRHWLVIALLVLINVTIFGCVILILLQRVMPFG